MPLEQCLCKQVMLKVVFLEKPCGAKITSVADGGIWVEGEITGAIQRAAAGWEPAVVPQDKRFLESFPLLFVPLQQIQWLAFGKQAEHEMDAGTAQKLTELHEQLEAR